jgi:hypothetical protein
MINVTAVNMQPGRKEGAHSDPQHMERRWSLQEQWACNSRNKTLLFFLTIPCPALQQRNYSGPKQGSFSLHFLLTVPFVMDSIHFPWPSYIIITQVPNMCLFIFALAVSFHHSFKPTPSSIYFPLLTKLTSALKMFHQNICIHLHYMVSQPSTPQFVHNWQVQHSKISTHNCNIHSEGLLGTGSNFNLSAFMLCNVFEEHNCIHGRSL